jgi:superfamily II DNA or RNA helicase
MYLRKYFRMLFDNRAIQQGEAFVSSGDVVLTQATSRSATVEVMDDAPYTVLLERSDSRVRAGCECEHPYCRHMWAAFIVTEREACLMGVLGEGPPSLEMGRITGRNGKRSIPAKTIAAVAPQWRDAIGRAARPAAPRAEDYLAQASLPVEVFFEINPDNSRGDGIAVSLRSRERRASGHWGALKPLRVTRAEVARIPDTEREIIERLIGARPVFSYGVDYVQSDYLLSGPAAHAILERICETGKAFLPTPTGMTPVMLRWDSGPPWRFELSVDRNGHQGWNVTGQLRRGAVSMPVLEPRFILEAGVICTGDTLAALELGGAFNWVFGLRRERLITVPFAAGNDLVEVLLRTPHLPPVTWPEELKFEEVSVLPRPIATFEERKRYWNSAEDPYFIRLAFEYDGQVMPSESPETGIYLSPERRLIRRDREAEQAAVAALQDTGARIKDHYGGLKWQIARKKVPAALRDLIRKGWHVNLDGKSFRSSSGFKAKITSGIDWFEVHGSLAYGDTSVQFPQLLAAIERGEQHVELEDGSMGVLPDDFLAQFGPLLRLGKKSGDHLRFNRSQTSLLDAMLLERGEVSADEMYLQARDRLAAFGGIQPAPQPKEFVGELRHYQLEGLGWIEFLRDLGLGGCLADDMGVGKTPQVLALLDTRRELREAAGNGVKPSASLAVVPRSLIYNWIQEAARFTPKLRVLDHSKAERTGDTSVFNDYDLVMTTYAMLRRDVTQFRTYEFDYAILDEAQAIKNSASESAKAARLLRAKHRLALSGTPIENHLGELWSLFEFLNPGMLGSASVFQGSAAALRNPSQETRELLARALRPLILRRTKDQVIKELPPKLEETIFCQMRPEQRKLYDEMRDHYRNSLIGRIDRFGLSKSKMHILEALLRLRQAACHPGLIDQKRVRESSAKLDNLLPQIEEVMDGGHKAIVFSQFTSLLSIVRGHLDRSRVNYEYLDGKTKDRQAAVERFQNDPDCKLFLVSLKAGGLGLNLTAAEYVFLLDPWWNPAVESQAIDRAHRIGQTKPVFAYRLICSGTVEEKVLELQKSKKALADAIIGEDNRLIGNLQREDLELLLS